MKKKSTSWDKVAKWYDDLLSLEGTYQQEVILPNVMRLVDPKPNQIILDLACGQGFFAKHFIDKGAEVVGLDLSPELIARAKKNVPKAKFFVANAENLSVLKNNSVDSIVCVLALQNIKNISAVFKECNRVLKNGGHFSIVLNHPAFRVPKHSSWGWDEAQKIQFRRIDEYLSEISVPIEMQPGKKDGKGQTTLSFHRPLQFWFKLLNNSGFVVTRLEEWVSHKINQPGPKAAAENKARHEFPLFLYLEGRKN
jgi:ubiquinone/menaquinone biosynthesis C-methylase UbiE